MYAFKSDNGLMVSMVFGFGVPVTDIDTSGSIMRKDLPQGLLVLLGYPIVGNNKGVLFSDPPATNCSYTVMPKKVVDCLAVVSEVILMILILLVAASVQLVKQIKNMQKGSIFNQEILKEIGDLT